MHIVSSYFAYYANSANSADICIKYILSMYDICCIYMYILTILLLCPTAGAREMLQRLRGGGELLWLLGWPRLLAGQGSCQGSPYLANPLHGFCQNCKMTKTSR